MTEKSLRQLQREAWAIAEDNGFHEGERSRAKVLALIHSEVSEALEVDRENDADYFKKEYAEELADIVIRVFDHAESEGIDLQSEVERKNAKNEGREYRHGKEY